MRVAVLALALVGLFAASAHANWYFMSTVGTVGKHDFNDPIKCEQARLRVVQRLGAALAKQVDAQCTGDPAPTSRVDFKGDVNMTLTEPKK